MGGIEIRESTFEDIPQIIEVLKASLGEVSSKKTEAVWKYKHLDNPFGKSLVLIAVKGDLIIGVRAFMKWKWQLGNEDLFAYRAVDTATHPDYQGKGIFKKLTLEAVEIARRQENSFIFNTPNSQSLPGYLKMGWKEVDKLKVRIHPRNLLSWSKNKTPATIEIKNFSENTLVELISNYNTIKAKENKLFTFKSQEHLCWRFENNPLQEYEVRSGRDFYMAAYIKKHKYFRELRISEHIYYNESGLKEIKKVIKSLNRKYKPQIITTAGLNIGFGVSGNYGPVLTLNKLNLGSDKDLDELMKINNWANTLGDLELF